MWMEVLSLVSYVNEIFQPSRSSHWVCTWQFHSENSHMKMQKNNFTFESSNWYWTLRNGGFQNLYYQSIIETYKNSGYFQLWPSSFTIQIIHRQSPNSKYNKKSLSKSKSTFYVDQPHNLSRKCQVDNVVFFTRKCEAFWMHVF